MTDATKFASDRSLLSFHEDQGIVHFPDTTAVQQSVALYISNTSAPSISQSNTTADCHAAYCHAIRGGACDRERAMSGFSSNQQDAGRAVEASAVGDGVTRGSATAQSAEGPTVYVGSADSNVYALDAETGDEQWTFQTDSVVDSSPTVVDGTVYVGSWDNNVYALDAVTGEQQWTFTTGANVTSSPTVVNVSAAGDAGGRMVFVGSYDNSVYALDAADGTEQWSVQTDEVRSSPTVVDGTVFVGAFGYNDDDVYALDAVDGSEQWSFPTGFEVGSSPTMYEDTVFVGAAADDVYALDAGSGSEQWSFQAPSLSSPTVVDGTVFIGSFDNALYAFDAADGIPQWTFETGDSIGYSSPTVVDGTVFVGSRDNNLYAVDAEEGSEQWSFQTGDDFYRNRGVESSPTVADGTVFVGSDDGNVYALDTGDGSEQWSVQTGDYIESSPTVVEDPENGRSVGSRVYLRTLGHHEAWGSRPPSADLVVDADAGENDPEYQTIQAAVADAEEEDVIEVLEGTYEGPILLDETVTIRTEENAIVKARFEDGITSIFPAAFVIDAEKTPAIEPTIRGFTFDCGDQGQAVQFPETEKGWTLEDVTLDGDGTMISAVGTSGDWTVKNATVTSDSSPSVSVLNAVEATGDWQVQDSHLKGGINAKRTTGNWLIEASDIYTDETAVAVNASESTRDWSIIGPADIVGASTGVNADNADGAWDIHRVNFREMTGDDATHITAVGVTDPPGNARRNFFEGTAPRIGGTGDEVLVGNQLAAPASDDATGIEVLVENAIETEENPSGVPFPQDGATVYLYGSDSQVFDEHVSVIQENDIGRLFDGKPTSVADRDVPTGPDGLVRYNGLDPAEDYYVIVEPPARNSGDVSALEFTATEGAVANEQVTLTDETFLEYIDADPTGDGSKLGHYPILSTIEETTGEIINTRISELIEGHERTDALSEWNNNDGPDDEDVTFATSLVGFVGEVMEKSATSQATELKKLAKDGLSPGDAVVLLAEMADQAFAAHMIWWSVPKPKESSQRYKAIAEELDESWFNSPHTSDAKEDDIENLPTVQTAYQQSNAAQSTLEELTTRRPPEGFNHKHARNVTKQVTDGLTSGLNLCVLPNGRVLNTNKGPQHLPQLNEAADRLESNESIGWVDIALGAVATGIGIVLAVVSGGIVVIVGTVIVGVISAYSAVGAVTELLENISNRQLFAAQFAKHHFDSLHDIENVQLINERMAGWLDGQFESPITGTVDGQIEFADQFDDPLAPTIPESGSDKTVATGEIDVGYENTGDVALPYRLVGYSRYSTDSDGERAEFGPYRTVYPDSTELEPEAIEPDSVGGTNLFYNFYIPPESPFRVYTAHTVFTLGGERVDDIRVPVTIDRDADLQQNAAANTEPSATDPERVAGYSSSATPTDQPMSKSEFDGHQPDVSTLVDTELTPDKQSTVTLTGAAETAELTILLFTTDNQDVDMFLEDEAGNRVGSVPAESDPVTEIPGAQYTELVDGARITLTSVSPETYSITVTCSPFAPGPVSVTALGIETPVRPAVLGTVPSQFSSVGEPGNTSKRPLTITEVGNQEPIEGVSFETDALTNGAGTALPDETLSVESEQTRIAPSEQTDVEVRITPPETLDLSGEPTRFSGEVTISSDNAGSLAVPMSILLLDTSIESAALTDADIGVTAARVSPSEVTVIPPVPGATVQSVYNVTIDGEGEVTLSLAEPLASEDLDAVRLVDGEYESVTYVGGSESTTFTLPAGSYSLVIIEGSYPTSSFTYSPFDPEAHETVSFDGSDSDNDGLTYEWDFGDGATDTGEMVEHQFSSSGDYPVTLTLTNDNGATDTDSETVTVSEPSPLSEQWSVETGDRTQFSKPAVTTDHVLVGGLDEAVYALDRVDGSVAWEFDRSGSLSDSSPTLADGRVFVGSGGGTIYALDATDGSVDWRVPTDSAVVSSPTVVDGTVYVGANDGTVRALSAADGTVEWQYTADAPVLSTIAVGSGLAIVTTDDGDAVALDADTGSFDWRTAVGTSGHSSPVYADGTIYVAGQHVYALDPTDGSVTWSKTYGGTAGSTPTVRDGTLYVGDAEGTVHALATADGSEEWSTSVGEAVGSSPAVTADGSRVVIGSLDGRVSLLDATNGAELTTYETGSQVRASPIIADGVAFVGSRAGTVFALGNVA